MFWASVIIPHTLILKLLPAEGGKRHCRRPPKAD
jgi:hypothetical protein